MVKVAVLDACVLYPPALRDLFMWLAVGMVYQPRWTDEIHDEWIRNVRKNRPDVSLAQLERARSLMDNINDESVVKGYEHLISSLHLPDINDRHVLAAAITADASLIVTFNLSDFPAAALKPHGVRAVHPDIFLCDLLDDVPGMFLHAIHRHRASLKKPPKTSREYLDTLSANGLSKFALRMEQYLDEI